MGIFGGLGRGWSRRTGDSPPSDGESADSTQRAARELVDKVAIEQAQQSASPDRPGQSGGATASNELDPVRPITRARIGAWCKDQDYHYFFDSDGDVGGLWRNRLFYFFLFGDEEEILQIRGQWNRQVTIDRLEEILDVCNTWNEEKVWPKAYVRVRDNGAVHVMCEVATDLEHGVDDAQLAVLLRCGLETGNLFLDTVDEQYPDPAEARA